MNYKLFKRVVIWVFIVPILLFIVALLLAYVKQDAIVKSQIEELNSTYKGKIVVGDSHLAPFENFPDIAVKIDDVKIYESKELDAPIILDVVEIYTGFNFWDIIAGNYDIHSLIIEDGILDIIFHTDGSTNLENALSNSIENKDEKPLNIHLQKIELKNLDIHQREEVSNMDIETLIYWAKGGFNNQDVTIAAHVNSEFELNVIKNNDTTYFKNKHFEFHTDLVYNKKDGMLVFKPSGITMEHGDFEIKGSIDTKNEMNVDIDLSGTKPSFDMFIAFAPTELIPVLERYKNEGNIYFNATLQGPTTQDRQPLIKAKFGASEAYLENSKVNKRIDRLGFSGSFTNGAARNFQTMEFSLNEVTANLERGDFTGNVVVKNFEAPEIDMQLHTDFDIPFIVRFLNLTDVKDANGSVEMELKFHDIVDLDHPEKVLNNLNQAYFAELKIENLTFKSKEFPAPLEDLDAHLIMNGKQAQLDLFDVKLGNSDLSITGTLSDLPAIVHHTEKPVDVVLDIKSNILDIAQLSTYSKKDSIGINERIENLKLDLSFNALANAFTESIYLPKGAFFIDNFYADLKNYPHTLHDFKADVLIDHQNLNIVDFSGFIDTTDFHINGTIYDYGSWMRDEINGDVKFDISAQSDLLKLDNLFAYQGENYVPQDYRHEEVKNLELHLKSNLHYVSNQLSNVKIELDQFEGKMKVHPLKFQNFNGTFQYGDEHLVVENFKGTMGRTNFEIGLNYYLGKDQSIKKRDNSLSLKSPFVDFDALSNYNLNTPTEVEKGTSTDHQDAFNIYELPFTDMKFNVDVDRFIYHRLDLKNMKGQLRTTRDHVIYVDTLSMNAAGGKMALKGSLNGSDPKNIILQPNLQLTNVDLDKLLFKFENFGQDVILSENLHGKLTTDITGKILVYPDLTAAIDQSEVYLDTQVLNGRLENYAPVLMLSDYFGDKNLTRIRFDTLQNHMDIKNGKISIPNMTIESTLGHMEISGTQDINGAIDYYVRIPWRVMLNASRNKIFGSKENDPEIEDQIIKVNSKKRTRYINLNITGTLEDYDIKLKKDKRK